MRDTGMGLPRFVREVDESRSSQRLKGYTGAELPSQTDLQPGLFGNADADELKSPQRFLI